MSDLLFNAQSDAPTEEEDDEQVLKFARCSRAAAEDVAVAVVGNKRLSKREQRRQAAANATLERKATSEKIQDGMDDHLTTDQPNLRRSHLTYRHLVISLSTSLVIGLLVLYAGWRFYEREIAPRLGGFAPSSPAQAEGGLKEALAKADEQIAALQKQLDVMRREQLLMQQNTRESLESISSVLNNPKLTPAPAVAAAAQPGVARMAEAVPDISPTQQEFIQLKERNRLTAYADEAIATGMRKPLEVLVEYLRDPGSTHLHEAAQAEYMRAVRAIQLLQREDPGYRLPIAELFKDQNIRDEADVKPEVLLKLLDDHKQPWEVRLRVCFLLLGSNLPETNARLIKAIKEDPSLDVAKHAQLALEQRVKKRFRIFDIPAIEEWSKSQAK